MLKLGLIGAGYLGKIHLGLLTQMNNVHFMGFFDTNAENVALLNQQYGTPPFADASSLINVCDALVVAAPTQAHHGYAQQCLQAGKHVFMEKPVTATIDEAQALLPLVQQTGLHLQIGMVERFNPAFTAAKPHLKGIQHISCTRLAPFTPRGADVSVVFDVMIHDIDIVLSLVNLPIQEIKASGQKLVSDTYDVANAVVHFEHGLTAHFTASSMAERKYRLMDITSPDGIYRVDFLDRKLTRHTTRTGSSTSLAEAYLQNDPELMESNMIEVQELNAIGEELKSFVDCIGNNKKVVVSLDDGIRAMQLAKEIEVQMDHQS